MHTLLIAINKLKYLARLILALFTIQVKHQYVISLYILYKKVKATRQGTVSEKETFTQWSLPAANEVRQAAWSVPSAHEVLATPIW